jgi:hypothetical protein
MKRIMLLCFAMLLVPLSLSANVVIQVNARHFEYQSPPSLVDVLEPVALTSRWYWPAAKLYRLSVSTPEKQRTEVLQLLDQIKRDAPTHVESQLNALQFLIKQWRLAERVVIPIDYDRARIEAAFNPRFEPGQYLLQLVKRPQSVQFWGALHNSPTFSHRGGTAIADYVAALSYSDLANLSEVYVIQPDGRIVKSGVASWNRQHVEAMPGAQVFVPFSSTWFGSDMQRLNDSLLALALHRVE